MAITIAHEFHPCPNFNWLPSDCSKWPSFDMDIMHRSALWHGIEITETATHCIDLHYDQYGAQWCDGHQTITATASAFRPLKHFEDSTRWGVTQEASGDTTFTRTETDHGDYEPPYPNSNTSEGTNFGVQAHIRQNEPQGIVVLLTLGWGSFSWSSFDAEPQVFAYPNQLNLSVETAITVHWFDPQ